MWRRSSLWFRGVEELDTGYRGPPEVRPATVVEWRGRCPDRAGSRKRECGGSGGRACLEGAGYSRQSLGWPFDPSIRAVGSDVNPDQNVRPLSSAEPSGESSEVHQSPTDFPDEAKIYAVQIDM